MTRFVVDLGDIALSKETQAAISGDMQKLVLGHLAGIRYDQPFVTKFPHDWWCLVARHGFDMLFDAEKQLNRALVTARAGIMSVAGAAGPDALHGQLPNPGLRAMDRRALIVTDTRIAAA